MHNIYPIWVRKLAKIDYYKNSQNTLFVNAKNGYYEIGEWDMEKS